MGTNRSRTALSNPGSASSLNSFSNNNNSNQTCASITLNGCARVPMPPQSLAIPANLRHQPQQQQHYLHHQLQPQLHQQQCQSTTRLIIPINKDYTLSSSTHLSNTNGVLKESDLVRTSSAGYMSSSSGGGGGGSGDGGGGDYYVQPTAAQQDEIDIVIYDQDFYTSDNGRLNASTRIYEAKENSSSSERTTPNRHYHRSCMSRHDVLHRGESPKPINGKYKRLCC